MKNLILIAILLTSGHLALADYPLDLCTRNPHVIRAFEEKTSKKCESITRVDLGKIYSIEIDMMGDSLAYSDLRGLYLDGLTVKNLGNKDVHGVFDGICIRSAKCDLSLSFMGQKVVFTHPRDDMDETFFERMTLNSLTIKNVQFDIGIPSAFEQPLEDRLFKQTKLKRLEVSDAGLYAINFYTFENNLDLEEIVLAGNKFDKGYLIFSVFEDLQNLKLIDISRNNLDHFFGGENIKQKLTIRACEMGPDFKKEKIIEAFKNRPNVSIDFCQ